jgi:4-hydroxybenzoate polyprenyltransferase
VRLKTALRLGRVSNLPTVWTNTLAGAVLAGADSFGAGLAVMLAAFSLFYVGGMFLNDAFDAETDATERPERPIPSGEIGRGAVFGWGFAMLVAGIALLGWVGYGFAPRTGAWPAVAGIALAAVITLYDWNHKQNVFSPVVMGLCRVMVYVAAALCYSLSLPYALHTGATLMLCYLIGLTYVAKQENLAQVRNLWPLLFLAAPVAYGGWLAVKLPVAGIFWLAFTGWGLVALWFLKRRRKGDIARAVVSLIAGISLLDAMLIAGTGAHSLALLGLAGFGVTLFLQRYISGT